MHYEVYVIQHNMYTVHYSISNKLYYLSIYVLILTTDPAFHLYLLIVPIVHTGTCSLIELKDEPNLTRLRDHKNWYLLSLAEKSELVKLCERLHPRKLEGTGDHL